jgi:hypothetical protein
VRIAAGVDDGDLEHADGQVGVRGGGEPVEGAVALVLGEVHPTADRVDRGCLVRELPHRRQAQREVEPGGVALVDEPEEVLLARQPRAPRRGPAGAVVVGAGEHRVGRHDVALGVEPHRAHAAVGDRLLGVRDVDPAAVVLHEDCAAVRAPVPGVLRSGAVRERHRARRTARSA